jgi:hypothetical protein
MTHLTLDALISAHGEAAAIAKDCALARALGTINDSPQAAAMAAEAEARIHARFRRLAAALGYAVTPICHHCALPTTGARLCEACAETERKVQEDAA